MLLNNLENIKKSRNNIREFTKKDNFNFGV